MGCVYSNKYISFDSRFLFATRLKDWAENRAALKMQQMLRANKFLSKLKKNVQNKDDTKPSGRMTGVSGGRTLSNPVAVTAAPRLARRYLPLAALTWRVPSQEATRRSRSPDARVFRGRLLERRTSRYRGFRHGASAATGTSPCCTRW